MQQQQQEEEQQKQDESDMINHIARGSVGL